MVGRAQIDRKVINAWAGTVSSVRKGWLKGAASWAVGTAVAYIPYGIGIIQSKVYLASVIAISLFYGSLIALLSSVTLRCPHCGKNPRTGVWHQAPLYQIDYCPHCYYWLVDPRQSSRLDT